MRNGKRMICGQSFFSESLEEMMEKKAMLEVLKEALDSLMPEERELAEKVFGEEMSVCEFARQKGGKQEDAGTS